jgi:hypothetical protein
MGLDITRGLLRAEIFKQALDDCASSLRNRPRPMGSSGPNRGDRQPSGELNVHPANSDPFPD